jgi:hypothetical protein
MASAMVMMGGVRQELRREVFRANLYGKRAVARRHEALRNERAHGECKEHHASDQDAGGLIWQPDAHRPRKFTAAAKLVGWYTSQS